MRKNFPSFKKLKQYVMETKTNHQNDKIRKDFLQDVKQLLYIKPDPETKVVIALYAVGSLCFPLFAGALWGFKYAYGRLNNGLRYPFFSGQPLGVYAAMFVGALLGLVIPLGLAVAARLLASSMNIQSMAPVLLWLFINFVFCTSIMFFFRRWREGIFMSLEERGRHGTARFAEMTDLDHLSIDPEKGGFYIGDYRYYNKSGHFLSVAGTRGGKGVNLIIPNLLKAMGTFFGSWVIIDPKGENAAITARVRRERGHKVVILNPWDLNSLGGASFNPLDILKADRLNLSDDVQMIAEAIVPMTAAGDTDHFNNRARTIISALLLHLVTARPKDEQNLATLWRWLRLSDENWLELLNQMSQNTSPAASEIVVAAANEIVTLKEQSEREYGSVISTAQKWTDFLKSPALRDSLTPSGDESEPFNPADLTNEMCVVYVVIPADRLKTHSQWLRLVVTSLMRSVIRQDQTAAEKPMEVCFMLDEAYALGYLSEIEVGLGSYAGYGVHIWAIYQNLVQIADTYGNNWENFISSCAVRHFFNVSDVTTAEYVSKMLGQYSVPSYDALGNVNGSSARNLVNPDELRQRSSNLIYTIIDDLPPAVLPKRPYFLEPNLKLGEDYDQNPYIRG
jgi:type IV secretion system protein VirD4